MFERFTKQAREVVKSAVEVAGRQGSGRVGAEHLLIAVAGVALDGVALDGPAHAVLPRWG